MTGLQNSSQGSLPASKTMNIYHETQSRLLCALHVLNSLLQDAVFSQEDLDNICEDLTPNTWINPHKSLTGLGNYDVNVIMAALKRKGLDTKWFDKRKDVGTLDLSEVYGFVLNLPSKTKFLGLFRNPLGGKHWIALRKIGQIYYNLDSDLKEPEAIGEDKEMIEFLKSELASKDRELLLVVKEDNAERQNE